MNWEVIGFFAAIVVFGLFVYLKKYSGGKTFFSGSIKGEPFAIATPRRAEMILLALYFIFFFIMDLAQNKFQDLGKDYQVIAFWNITSKAFDILVIFLILFHIVLFALFLMSLQSKDTSKVFDIIVGLAAFAGVAILFGGVYAQMVSPTIYFLFTTMPSINLYHIGVYIEIFAGLYWAFTK